VTWSHARPNLFSRLLSSKENAVSVLISKPTGLVLVLGSNSVVLSLVGRWCFTLGLVNPNLLATASDDLVLFTFYSLPLWPIIFTVYSYFLLLMVGIVVLGLECPMSHLGLGEEILILFTVHITATSLGSSYWWSEDLLFGWDDCTVVLVKWLEEMNGNLLRMMKRFIFVTNISYNCLHLGLHRRFFSFYSFVRHTYSLNKFYARWLSSVVVRASDLQCNVIERLRVRLPVGALSASFIVNSAFHPSGV